MVVSMKYKTVSQDVCNARYSDLKEDINEIKDDIKNIKNNHLSHIETDIAMIKTWGAVLGIIPTIISTIILIYQFLK